MQTAYKFFAYFFVVALLISNQLLAQEPERKQWKGTLNAGATELRLELNVIRNGEELSGELISLDQGNARLRLAYITLNATKFSFTVPNIGASFSGKLQDGGKVAEGEFIQGGASFPLTLTESSTDEEVSKETLREAWIGKLDIRMMKPVMQFRIVDSDSGEKKVYFDSVTEGLTGFKGTWSKDDKRITFNIPEIQLSYSGTLNGSENKLEGTWTQGQLELPLTLTKQNTEYKNLNVWDNRPQKPKPPYPYTTTEVTFENASQKVTLAGTLTVPLGSGPHPAVVLISGSGPQDRDQFFMEHRTFLVLADHLSRHGVAVLRYDDRGTAQSTGDYGAATIGDFARDAAAAVNFLKDQEKIKPDKIGLIGHSEGGLVAPLVAKLRDDIAFTVLMASPAVEGKSVLLSQSEAILRANNISEAEINVIQEVNNAIMSIAASAKPGSDVTDEIMAATENVVRTLPEAQRETAGETIRSQVRAQMAYLQGNWMRHFLSYDPRPALREIDFPVLALVGTKDLQVIPELNVPPMKEALAENTEASLLVLDGLNHLFQSAETGLMTEYAEIEETINPSALLAISNWIGKL